MIINGSRLYQSDDGLLTDIVSPNDGTVVGSFPEATDRDIELAAATAQSGFQGWSRTTANSRASVMHRAASLIRDDAQSLASLISTEMGKPIVQARAEAENVAELIDFFAEEGLRITGEIPKLDRDNELPLIIKEPVGVVAAITPFNYPIALLAWKLGPALITGCTVVAKPDEHAPSAVLRLAEIFLEAGLPENVFQVITGGPKVGQALVENQHIDKIAFTGGITTGRRVAAMALSHGKKLTLELGGQCPAIVARGADLDAIIQPMVDHTFKNSGQYCYRINRIYVDELISEEFTQRFVDATRRLSVGVSFNEKTDIGPLCHDGIAKRTTRHIANAQELGGQVLTGGARLTQKEYQNGWFMIPAVVGSCNQRMLVMQEETFGPVVGITSTSSLEESIHWANDSIYGLAAYVFASDLGEGLQAALRLRTGSVWVNGVKRAYLQCPFGGYKASGFGREKSHFGLDEYLELKSIYLQLPERQH